MVSSVIIPSTQSNNGLSSIGRDLQDYLLSTKKIDDLLERLNSSNMTKTELQGLLKQIQDLINKENKAGSPQSRDNKLRNQMLQEANKIVQDIIHLVSFFFYFGVIGQYGDLGQDDTTYEWNNQKTDWKDQTLSFENPMIREILLKNQDLIDDNDNWNINSADQINLHNAIHKSLSS